MCGIVGFVSDQDQDTKDKIIRNMASRMEHRGPDGEGYFADDFVALGHKRLAILDLEGGQQPIYSEDQNYVLVCNGEIYNYQDIKEELLSCGYKFHTHTDCEILIYGYDK